MLNAEIRFKEQGADKAEKAKRDADIRAAAEKLQAQGQGKNKNKGKGGDEKTTDKQNKGGDDKKDVAKP